MAKFIRRSEFIQTVEYRRDFQLVGQHRYTGFSFPCDKDGNLTPPLSPEGDNNYAKCLNGTYDVIDHGVCEIKGSYREPAVIECNHCRLEVTLSHHMTNRCDCGTFYNGSGQELSHPRNWGEETGERFDDNGNQIL